jgi:hypothetical protein
MTAGWRWGEQNATRKARVYLRAWVFVGGDGWRPTLQLFEVADLRYVVESRRPFKRSARG